MGNEAKRLITGFTVNFISLVDQPANGKEIILKSVDAKQPEGADRFRREFAITKSDSDKQIVYGLVAVPGETDTQGDVYTAQAVEKAMEEFMFYGWNNRNIDREHDYEARDAFVRESWIVKENDSFFSEIGAWAVGIKVNNADLWAVIKSGEVGGLSLAGWAYEFSDTDDSGIAGFVGELSAEMAKADEIMKSGKTLSAKTKEKLKSALDSIKDLLDGSIEKAETEEEMKPEEMKELLKAVLAEEMGPITARLDAIEKSQSNPAGKTPEGNQAGEGTQIEKTAEEKAKEEMTALVKSAISDALAPLDDRLKTLEKTGVTRGNSEPGLPDGIEKSAFYGSGIIPKI